MSEFKKLNQEEITEEQFDPIYTREPKITKCKFCGKKILTEAETETTWTGILLSVVLFLLFNIFSIVLILVLIPLTQKTNHRCPSCLNIIGECNFYDLISLSDKVISFTVGSFALIISKKQLLGLFTFLFILILFFVKFYTIDTSLKFIDETFDEFYSECSPEKFQNVATFAQAKNFCHSYRYSCVQWEGNIVRIDYEQSFMSRYRLSILVKMRTEVHSQDGDLYLKVNEYEYEKYKNVFYQINRGDRIAFNATIIDEGSERNAPFLDLFGVSIVTNEENKGKIEIDPHIHHNGRYSLDKEIKKNSDHVIHKDEAIYDDINMKEFVVDKEVNIDEKQHETYH